MDHCVRADRLCILVLDVDDEAVDELLYQLISNVVIQLPDSYCFDNPEVYKSLVIHGQEQGPRNQRNHI